MTKYTFAALVSRAVALAMIGCLFVGNAAAVWADPLPAFTGYTRPGAPNGEAAAKDGKIIFVADEGEEAKALLGGTVYFTVIDTQADTQESFRWREKSADLIKGFVPGKESRGVSSPAFDTTARYIYLYQVVNDMPNTRSAIRNSSVYLMAPSLLTSWGHFQGHGFLAKMEEEKDHVIRPVSFDNPVDGTNRAYRTRDEYYLIEDLLRIGKFPNMGKATAIRPVAAGEMAVRNPSTVVLVGRPASAYLLAPSLPGQGYYAPPILIERRNNRPAAGTSVDDLRLQVNWAEQNLLQPRERSALFGFTSNYPPVYDEVDLRGLRVAAGGGIKPAGGEGIKPAVIEPDDEVDKLKPAADQADESKNIKPAAAESPGPAPAPSPSPSGLVPVPTPPVTGAFTPTIGTLGGQPFGQSGSGSTTGAIAGTPFATPPPASGGGAVGGGGNGDNGTGTTGEGEQLQGQSITQTQSVNLSVSQAQKQAQSQSQSQSQTGGGDGNIIPEPPSWLMVVFAILCLSLIWLIRRRGEMVPVGS